MTGDGNVFEQLNKENPEVAVVTAENDKAAQKKAAAKERLKRAREAYEAELQANPDIAKRLHALSGAVTVAASLGWSDSGSIIQKTKKTETADRTLQSVSGIVGYVITNNGSVAIPYTTEEFKKGADGIWVGTQVSKKLAPKGTANLSRKYMTIFASQPEISMEFANGAMTRSSRSNDNNSVDGELAAYYFNPAPETGIVVNSDEFKRQIGRKVKQGDKEVWVVKDEYAADFGGLNNPKPSGRGEGKAKTAENNSKAHDLTAALIRQMLAKENQM